MSLADDCEREVVAFHEFVEDWLAGRLDATADRYDRARAVIPDGFEIVSPWGERRDGRTLRADLREGHGALADADPPFEVRIADLRPRFEREETCLLTYEEWQRQDGDWRGRVSSALFRRDESAPNGVEWGHLHETWLPDDAEPPDERSPR